MRFLVLLSLFAAGAMGSCNIGPLTDPKGKASPADPTNYYNSCISTLRDQVRMEFKASLQYLAMAAYFEQDTVNLKGFAKFFWESADEERQHGLKFIEYLRHRGDDSLALFDADIKPILEKYSWSDGLEALRDSLLMEKKVSGSIKKIVDACSADGKEDYLTGDWLTGTWLEEQMDGQRKLAGLINTLSNFRMDHEALGDWMFSESLLEDK
uniref:Ferritin n=1 Tax=Caligus rogercresseyi TaxID=217165 RepID=C1BND3_CALRO|nr:Ferritin subunit precursor [Caligus rogercresseyi]ACO10541.1 Ferritin subunit precursor [Caligus rogercresseyi]